MLEPSKHLRAMPLLVLAALLYGCAADRQAIAPAAQSGLSSAQRGEDAASAVASYLRNQAHRATEFAARQTANSSVAPATWQVESSANRAVEPSAPNLPDEQSTMDAGKQADLSTVSERLPDPGLPEDEQDGSTAGITSRPECEDQNSLSLEEVLKSVADSYPLLEVALAELAAAEGKALATWGNFDTMLDLYSISQPVSFYENYRNGFKLTRPLWQGGDVYSGYRIGRGLFEPWYLERETNAGGEFKVGAKQPFLQGYAIDGRRAAVQTAALERSRLEPDIRARILQMQRDASRLYWKWVAAGQVIRTQEYLLELARARNDNLVRRVEEGDLPKITEIDNGRFIAKRRAKVIESERKVQEAAIKLSLFFRDTTGQPLVAPDDRLPCDFPQVDAINRAAVESDIGRALAERPELLDLDFQRRQVEVALCYAQNQTLPKLDGYAETRQEVGAPSKSLRDKSELEIELGLLAEVPLQRRAAVGKIRAAQAKLGQIAAKRQFVEDKIRTQVQDSVSALDNAYQRIEQARDNLRLTEQSLRLGRLRFEEGDIDIIELNIYETSLADAELLLIDAELEYFSALADYQAALGLGFEL